MDRNQPVTSNLMDQHNRLVADILTRYRTLMMLATVQAEGERNNATPETMAVAGISMKMEFDGLYTSIKELLTLSRRIKELWVFGPLAREDQGRDELRLDEHVGRVTELLAGLDARMMKDIAGRVGAEFSTGEEAAQSSAAM